jgi:low temperature requirement protein LtrA
MSSRRAGPADPATALVLVGGPALYLFGSALFTALLFGGGPVVRIAGLVALAALLLVATNLSPLWLSILTTLILVAVAAIEAVWFSRHPNAAEELGRANARN